MLLDGVDEYVNCGTDASLSFERTNTFSIGAWINMSSLAANNFICGKLESSGNFRGWRVQVQSTGDIQFFARNSSGKVLQLKTNNTFTTSTWYHVVMTYDGSSAASGVTIYVNGNSEALTTISDTLDATIINSEPFSIGAQGLAGTPVFYFNGYLDEIVVYNTELTSGQVTNLYGNGCPVNPQVLANSADIVSYWPVRESDDMTGGTGIVEDQVGTNDGTPQNTESGDLTITIPC